MLPTCLIHASDLHRNSIIQVGYPAVLERERYPPYNFQAYYTDEFPIANTMAEVFRFSALQDELQVLILEECDMDVLFNLCLVNRELYSKAHPILWKIIDFLSSPQFDAWDDDDNHRRFLMTCVRIRESYPSRWAELAALPKVLKLARVAGIYVSPSGESPDWQGDHRVPVSEQLSIFDIISDFHNLETFSLFVKSSLFFTEISTETCSKIKENMPKLKEIELGGEVSGDVVQALLTKAEQIEKLSLINIVMQGGQETHPTDCWYLEGMVNRFTSLRCLHLSKLAELHHFHRQATSSRFSFEIANEKRMLRDWARFLGHVSSSLTHLTLGNCYYMNNHHDSSYVLKQLERLENEQKNAGSEIDALELEDYVNMNENANEVQAENGDSSEENSSDTDEEEEEREIDPTGYGKGSSDRARNILFPAMAALQWPKLEKLVLKGMKTFRPLTFLDLKVDVEYRRGGMSHSYDDVTPMVLSPPESLFEDPFDRAEVSE